MNLMRTFDLCGNTTERWESQMSFKTTQTKTHQEDNYEVSVIGNVFFLEVISGNGKTEIKLYDKDPNFSPQLLLFIENFANCMIRRIPGKIMETVSSYFPD